MERFYAIPNTPVFLGRVGETKAREIAFDISQWLAVYGEGSVQLMARRAGETVMYPVPLTRDGNLAIWTVTAGDVAKAGRTGECELSYTPDSDTMVKSESWSTSVLPSMAGGVVDAPEAAQAWIDALRKESAAVEQLAGGAEESAAAAAKSAVTAGSMAAAAAKSAEAAAGSASEAKTAKTSAQKAAVQAEEASQHYPFPHEGTGTWWVWDMELGKYVNTGLSYGGSTGTEDHRKLTNLEAPNQHPITAIAGLSGRLSVLSTAIDNVDEQVSTLSEEIVTTSESKVAAHNAGADTHSDIRLLIQGLTDRLNALADSDDTTLDQLSEVVAYIKSNRDLISAITTDKVSVADIIDNLTTNVSNKPLSAAQGVALKALIDGIVIPDKLPNPNALTFTGAVTGSYDGSAPLSVEIPSGGGGEVSGETWQLLGDVTLGENASSVIFSDIGLETYKKFAYEFSANVDSGTQVFVNVNGADATTYAVGNIPYANAGYRRMRGEINQNLQGYTLGWFATYSSTSDNDDLEWSDRDGVYLTVREKVVSFKYAQFPISKIKIWVNAGNMKAGGRIMLWGAK